MATLLQMGELTTDPTFALRVAAGLMKVAQDVIHEDPDTPGHAKRLDLAASIRNNAPATVGLFMWYLATNDAIATAGPTGSTDNDILWVLSSVYNEVAGA